MPYADKEKRRAYHKAYNEKWNAKNREARLAKQRKAYELISPPELRKQKINVNGRVVEYRAYHAAKTRCFNRNQDSWEYYGGLGVQFKFTSFEQFYAELGPKPSPKHSLDRFPNTYGDYEPGNVRWATDEEQVRNRRPTFYIANGTFFGKKHSEKTKQLMSERRKEWHRRNS